MAETDLSGRVVQLLDPATGQVEEVDPTEAQQAFVSGKRQLLSGATIPLVAEDGTVADFPAEKVQGALGAQWRFAQRDDVLRAEALASPAKAALVGAAHELTFTASSLLMEQAGVEGIQHLLDSPAGVAGRVTGGALGLVGSFGGSAAARGAVGAAELTGLGAARQIAQRTAQTALAPTRFLDDAARVIETKGAEALAHAGAGEATQKIASGLVSQGVVGAGVGALGAVTEEALGNPEANAQSLWSAAGMGAVVGGALGGGIGAAGSTIGHLLSPKAKAGALALADPDQAAAALQAQGLDVESGNPIVRRFTKLIREDVPGLLGFDTEAIRTVNRPQAQAWIRDRQAIIDATSRDLDAVVKQAVTVQDQIGQNIGQLRPRVTQELIGPGASGQAVHAAGQAIADIRTELQQLYDREVMAGLGEGGTGRALRKQLQALDEFEARTFEAAGIPRQYEERTVTQEAQPSFMGEQRAPAQPRPQGPERPPGAAFGAETQQNLPIDLNRVGDGTRGDPLFNETLDPRADFQKQVQISNKSFEQLDAEGRQALRRWDGRTGTVEGLDYTSIRKADRGMPAIPEARQTAAKLNELIANSGTVDMPLYRGLVLAEEVAQEYLKKLRQSGIHNEPALHGWSFDPKWATEKFATSKAPVKKATVVDPDDMFGDLGDIGFDTDAVPDTTILFRMDRGQKGLLQGANDVEHEVLRSKGDYVVRDITQDETGRYQVLLAPKDEAGTAAAAARGVDAGPEQLTFDALVPGRPEREITQSVPVTSRTVTQAKNWSLQQLGERFHLPDSMGAQTFAGLDQLRTVFGKIPAGADPEIRDVALRVQKRLQDALEDRSAFGRAAEMQTKLGGAIRDRDSAWKSLQEHYDVTNPKAARTFMDQLTSMQGDAAKEALDRWVSANQAVGEISDQFYRGSQFGSQARATATAYARLTNDMREKVTVFNALTRLQNQERALRWGTNNALQYALTGAAAGALGETGLPGVATMGLAGALVGTITHPGNAAITRANLAVVRDKVAKAIGGLASQAVKRVSEQAGGVGVQMPTLPRTVGAATRALLSAKSSDDRAEAYEERRQQLQVLSDPQAFLDHSERSFGDLATHAPNHTVAMQTQGQRAMQYLLTQLPVARAGTGLAYGPPARPSDGDLLRFGLTDRAVQDPLGALEAAIMRGVLLPNERAALEAVSPQLLEGFQREVIARAEPGKVDARAQRLIASIMGGPSGLTTWAQSAHAGGGAPQGGSAPGGAPPGPRPRPKPASAAYVTPLP